MTWNPEMYKLCLKIVFHIWERQTVKQHHPADSIYENEKCSLNDSTAWSMFLHCIKFWHFDILHRTKDRRTVLSYAMPQNLQNVYKHIEKLQSRNHKKKIESAILKLKIQISRIPLVSENFKLMNFLLRSDKNLNYDLKIY